MKRLRAISLSVLAAVLLVGSTVYAFANAPEKGSMGVWGYVADSSDAQLEVADQIGVDTLVVDVAKAPTDGWVVVHADDDGMPGERVGVAAIAKGENRKVEVKLKGVKSEKVIVAIHADRGTPGKFDFSMDDPTGSADRPFFVGRKELAKSVVVREFGVKDPSGTAAIKVSDQTVTNSTLVVDAASAPTGAWIVVHLDDKGMPGKRVGVQRIAAGQSGPVSVALDPAVKLTPNLLVAVHADRGTPGAFEFDMDDKLNSPDQPFFVGGSEVATKVAVN